MDEHTKKVQNALNARFSTAYAKYMTAGSLGNMSLEELQTLIAGECWMDGAEFETAIKVGEAYRDVDSARHYLRHAFNYEAGI